ncbi:HAD-IA family hydrolase [uncultured Rhodoblastus sp.]|uniref:HAD-IA family hydrolase n=1 Tax=uncultured Rhodoblastus sp. TaxID=543037 RepID=UPI0025FA77CE|nr:HAD-IA family hydrolase [uncultured Rhodoblastus sp.]
MKLIIFDIDGTLVDSQNFIVEAQKQAFNALGLPVPNRGRALSVVGLSLIEAFDVLTLGQGPSEQLAEAYKLAWKQLHADPGFDDPLYPGAEQLVRELARREDCLLGVATGKSRAGVSRLFERRGWSGLFATVQTADDAPSKPAPDMIFQALAETGVSVRECWMIGDTTFDMAMARNAGARAIGVGWGYHGSDLLLEAGAATIAEDFGALRDILEAVAPCATI